nr:putative reverse transcriptase domain-containing protein [Tanacetum cinerariifolium]
MTWEVLKKKMTDKYCPHRELKKLEIKLWNLKFVANENEKIDKYISGLPDNIYGNVKSSKPRTLDETIELTNDLMDQKLRTYAKKAQKQPRASTTTLQKAECRQGALAKLMLRMLRGTVRKLPKKMVVLNAELQDISREITQAEEQEWGNRNAQGWVYAVGNAEKNGNAPINPDSNVVMGMFLLNNLYASILFDTGADRSFISAAFSSLVNIDPTPLGSSYDVKLADGKIVGIDTII